MLSPTASVCLIGFGEAGSVLGTDLALRGVAVRSYDILFDAPAQRPRLQQRCAQAGVDCSADLATALRGAKLVMSVVTATSATDVARAAAPLLQPGQIFIDLNSVSPDTKRLNAQHLAATGADYIDAAVMAPVLPQRLKVPLLLGGVRAAELAPALALLGMNARAVSAQIGVAAAIKMCRSIVVKGLEALTVEALLTARHYGADEAVLKSLAASYPSMGWDGATPDYLIARVAEHGRRRAAELREVGTTVAAAGLEPLMAAAIASRQDALLDAMAAANVRFDADAPFSWMSLADGLAGRPRPVSASPDPVPATTAAEPRRTRSGELP